MNDTVEQRALKLLKDWKDELDYIYETEIGPNGFSDSNFDNLFDKYEEVARALFPCKTCNGSGGDCDVGQIGEIVNFSCEDCGGTGRDIPEIKD